MKIPIRVAIVMGALFTLALFGFGCSDDDTPTNGSTPDTTPPKVAHVVGLNFQNVQVEFNEKVNKETAERRDNYLILERALRSAPGESQESAAAPGDTVHVATAVLLAGGTQVVLTTWSWMSDLDYNITVKGVKDVNGNQMTGPSTTAFTGSDNPDEIDPEIVSRSPAPDATGVGAAQSVIVQFSEPMDGSTLFGAFSWTHGSSNVPFTMVDRGNEFAFTPLLTLQLNTDYDVAISSAATDRAGNNVAPATWSFRTTSSADVRPPALESSSPTDGSVNVSTSSVFKLTFSETIDPLSLGDDAILVSPDPGPGTPYWSNNGKTLTFDPDDPLADDTQYTILIPQGAINDLAGHGLEESVTIQFTTGAFFALGAFSGRVEGDEFSADAKDPVGAVVIAPDRSPFIDGENMQIYGAEIVGADSTYTVGQLPDGWYYPFSILDSNGDGRLEPELGDAIGVYGIDFRGMDMDYDSLEIDNGNFVSDIDIQLFDPMVVAGKVVYIGDTFTQEQLMAFSYNVGLFDTTGFDVDSPDWSSPDFSVTDMSVVYDPDWSIDELESSPPLSAGTYWVAAYLEVGGSPGFDPGIDPSGVYSVFATGDWIAVTIADGTDALDTDIYLTDPEGGGPSPFPALTWDKTDDSYVPDSVKRARTIRSWMRRALDSQETTE
jgi:hypothetical protein